MGISQNDSWLCFWLILIYPYTILSSLFFCQDLIQIAKLVFMYLLNLSHGVNCQINTSRGWFALEQVPGPSLWHVCLETTSPLHEHSCSMTDKLRISLPVAWLFFGLKHSSFLYLSGAWTCLVPLDPCRTWTSKLRSECINLPFVMIHQTSQWSSFYVTQWIFPSVVCVGTWKMERQQSNHFRKLQFHNSNQ